MTATTLQPAPSSGLMSFMAGLTRFAFALAIAVFVTIGLFLLMRALIAVELVPQAEPEKRPVIEIAMVPPDEPITRTFPEALAEITPPPDNLRLTTSSADPTGESITVGPHDPIVVDPDISGVGNISRLPPPIAVRIAPVFPDREASRGIEGSCTIQYDILGSGRTANARAINCDSRGFERASLAAVAQWRHAVAEGAASDEVIQRGVQTRLDFQLEG